MERAARPPDEPFRQPSPAKVNWILRVGSVAADGYHPVQTALVALDLCDWIHVAWKESLAPGLWELRLAGPQATADIPLDGRNLVWRAIEALPEASRAAWRRFPCGISIGIEKHIPSQAGLGGGSSNAAAALVALAAWYPGSLSMDTIGHALKRIGSDCAFFGRLLQTGGAVCAWYTGRGDQYAGDLPGALATQAISVVTPTLVAPTGEVYSAFDRSDCAHARSFAGSLPPSDWVDTRHNDLEQAALASVPGLSVWKRALAQCSGGTYQLAGSGASWYAPIPNGATPMEWHEQVLAALRTEGLEPRFAWCGPLFERDRYRLSLQGKPARYTPDPS